MFDINKRKQFNTVGDLKKLLADLDDENKVCICGDTECWFHIMNGGGLISLDYDALDEHYEGD